MWYPVRKGLSGDSAVAQSPRYQPRGRGIVIRFANAQHRFDGHETGSNRCRARGPWAALRISAQAMVAGLSASPPGSTVGPVGNRACGRAGGPPDRRFAQPALAVHLLGHHARCRWVRDRPVAALMLLPPFPMPGINALPCLGGVRDSCNGRQEGGRTGQSSIPRQRHLKIVSIPVLSPESRQCRDRPLPLVRRCAPPSPRVREKARLVPTLCDHGKKGTARCSACCARGVSVP